MKNNKILKLIHNSYLIKNIFNFIDIKKKLQLLKYNKKYQNIINISLQDYKYFTSYIKLISKENEIFFIDKIAAKKSQLLKDCMDDDEDFKELNLINVNSKYLKLIIEFLEHYKDSEPKIPDRPFGIFEKSVDEWTKNFFSKLVKDDVFSLISESNFMDIKCLLDLCCSYIADSIRGKTPEEMRIFFSIYDDFTEEEENLIRNENQWNMDDL